MLRDYRTVRAIAEKIADAADATMSAYRQGRITYEPSITDRLLGTIEDRVRKIEVSASSFASLEESRGLKLSKSLPLYEKPGVSESGSKSRRAQRGTILWEAATLKSGSGSAGEEKRHGADFLGVLSVNTREYKTNKGFLAQAKRAEPGVLLSKPEWERMLEQCRRMVARSRDSYVMVYSKDKGIRFFSAQAVLSFRGRDFFELYSIGVRSFFERHIQSFVGDTNLNKAEVQILESLQTGPSGPNPNAYVLHLKAREELSSADTPLRLTD